MNTANAQHPASRSLRPSRLLPWAISAGALTAAVAAARWLATVAPLPAPAPRPAPDYAGALARVAALQERDDDAINPRCRSCLLSHGAPTATAILLLHGFTNCPAQYELFARQLFERGHNVLLPRLPEHGLEDRHTPSFARLSADAMVELAADCCDALHGLGERRVVIGFSLGGALAAWVAQARADIDHVALIAPAIAVHGTRPLPTRPAARLLGLLPNRFIAWDDAEAERAAGPNHAYAHYSTRAVGQLLRLGAAVAGAARRQIYACGELTLITNPLDDVVDNRGAARLAREWRRQGAPVTAYELPAAWGLLHDIMDPMQPAQQVARVYPQLIEWLGV